MWGNGGHDLDTTSKQIKVKVIYFDTIPIDFSYTTSYRLSIVTFALGRTVATINNVTDENDDDDRTDERHYSATVSTVGQKNNKWGVNFITLCWLLFARGRYKHKYFLSAL